jgi:hypothetical protein
MMMAPPPPEAFQYHQQEPPPPPSFDAASLPPPIMSFDAPSYSYSSGNNNNNNNTIQNDSAMFFAPSAPALEDLLDNQHQQEQHEHAQYLMSMPQPMAPPATQGGEESLESILGALEGLSQEEKKALLAEQDKIMASIEKKKDKQKMTASSNANADARANAFEQRSLAGALPRSGPSSNTVDLGNGEQVALHGQEKTRQAIDNGTAILVQCLSCSNWMQVAGTASLMFCPICQTVSPVEQNGAAGMTREEAEQMKADLELAEQLQKEEYNRSSGAEQDGETNSEEHGERRTKQSSTTPSSSRSPQQRTTAAAGTTTQEPGWMEWLGFGAPAPAPPAHMSESERRPLQRGEIGVSRPPGSNSRGGGLALVQTGEEETVTFPPSYDNDDADRAEDAAFARSSSSSAAHNVAERQPIFNYVADSITSAATSLSTALQMAEDEDGNVIGVDSSGLLAVTTVGRESNNNNRKEST